MDYRKVTFDDGIEVELDPDVAAEIEAARAANEDQLQRVRTAIASMPSDQRRHAWDAYRLLIRATTDADNALGLAAAIRAGDAELEATVKMLIHEINEARLRQDRDWEEFRHQPDRTEEVPNPAIARVHVGQRLPPLTITVHGNDSE